MKVIDIVIVALVVLAFALAARRFFKSESDGCVDCGSKSGCNHESGHCNAAQDMLKHANAAFTADKISDRQ